MDKKIFMCQCQSEGIVIEPAVEDKSIYLAIFNYSSFGKMHTSWWRRLEWCWHILKEGYPWTDQIILDYDTAFSVSKELEKCANANKVQ